MSNINPGWTKDGNGIWHQIVVVDNNVYLDGKLSNVQIFNKCLTQDEVKNYWIVC